MSEDPRLKSIREAEERHAKLLFEQEEEKLATR